MAICFTACALAKHLEYRARLCYRKLSIEKIRQLLIRVQASILSDKEKRIRYGLPSKMKKDARKIYNAIDIKRSITPHNYFTWLSINFRLSILELSFLKKVFLLILK